MTENKQPIHLVIITGMSGAGKTVAVQSLEDLGFFCVDNLPPMLIPKFAELIVQSGGKISKVALVIDLRGREFFQTLFSALKTVEEEYSIPYHILFLDADDATLVRRYKETRRSHPLATGGTPLEGIAAERKMLEEIKGNAHQLVNTSHLKPVQLKENITSRFAKLDDRSLHVNFLSFGFKYGIPIDADLVFDVRFLPNPHYIDSMRPHTGKDEDVYDYVMKWEDTQTFTSKLVDMLEFLLPNYQQEGKSQLVVGIGCTGGKHRSVAITEYINNRFKHIVQSSASHRDIEKDRS